MLSTIADVTSAVYTKRRFLVTISLSSLPSFVGSRRCSSYFLVLVLVPVRIQVPVLAI
ncbi:MAG: hypothetical protein SXQ77_01915 [Halobacteria archaeon]|nr:hypothetical protein [Halobacteria archaeon]